MYYKSDYHSFIGKITLISDEKFLVGLFIEGQKYFMDGIDEFVVKDNEIIKKTKIWLDKYFRGEKPSVLEIPLKVKGSKFKLCVLNHLLEIPYGEVRTYKDISKLVARDLNKDKMSSQAVGGAISRNPISIIIPCHRVIGSNKSLTGYAAGIDKKEKLLNFEESNYERKISR